MAWDDTLVLMVRHLINDYSAPYRYDDDRLKEAIVIGGLITSQDYSYTVSYTFDLANTTISPDPTDTSTYDAEAIALFSLKASCILSTNDFQASVRDGVRVQDGDDEIDTSGQFKGHAELVKLGPCKSYEKLLETLRRKKSSLSGKAIAGPFSSPQLLMSTGYDMASFFDMFRR